MLNKMTDEIAKKLACRFVQLFGEGEIEACTTLYRVRLPKLGVNLNFFRDCCSTISYNPDYGGELGGEALARMNRVNAQLRREFPPR